jgi:outer membrane protein
MTRSLLCSIVAVALTLGLSAGLAAAAEIKMAVVDIDSVSAQYTELTSRQAELGTWVQEKKGYLGAMQDFMFVSGEEFQEASRIYQAPKAQWSEEQKKREAELRSVSGNNEKKFLDLQAKPARTPEEQNQFSTLRDTFQARDRDLKAISAEFDKQLKQKRDDVQGKLVASVRAVIEKVSKEKGYQLVIDKSAVYFVAAPIDDITEEVLKSLNAGATPTPGAANGNPPNPQ